MIWWNDGIQLPGNMTESIPAKYLILRLKIHNKCCWCIVPKKEGGIKTYRT